MDSLIKYFETFSKKPRRICKTNDAEEEFSESSDFTDSSDNMSDDSPKGVNKHKSKEYRNAVKKYEKLKKKITSYEK